MLQTAEGTIGGKHFRPLDHDLARLRDLILVMGGWVERAIRDAIRALIECDEELARLTIERDGEINRMEIETDTFARTTIIRRQPVGSDLRAITGALKIVTDLERIGDRAAEICRQSLEMEVRTRKFENYLEVMADHVRRQVTQALDAYSSRDHRRALTVIDLDKHVDTLCRNYERNMLTVIMEDQRLITPALALMNVAQALERISDHATNICEMVIYIHLGHDIRHVSQEEALKMLDLKEGEWSPPTSW
ncbi:MAG: phosphate transport system regulatory protein PhoU [Zetaproteobacteria bacterium]|nr:MAG: phosphate transport system regulatory protein PhoU [Zetaproteobacteria bacterium]